ncbi:MAG: hypothetical protein DRJ15_11465 [Bacteroidetes bacterium]|nr:MAG: hypothetical protein DRJ15_11465 [Bacteroidota bacterium]
MGITNSNVSYSGLVEKYIGTAYDTVKYVADNMTYVIAVGEIDGIEDIADDIAEAIVIVEAAVVRAEAAALAAEASEINGAASAATAAADAASAQAAAIQTGNDVVQTGQDASQTASDVVITNSNVIITNDNVTKTNADAAQTQADAIQTQTDVVTTGANADRAETAEANTEATWGEFDELYLGAHAVPPIVDNNGAPLQIGALYQDTASDPDLMKFWDGAVWKTAYATSDAVNHASLTGLSADDHSVGINAYLNNLRHGLIIGNPHGVTKSEVGLGNVNNTSDANKEISNATKIALDAKITEPVIPPVAGGLVLVSDATGEVTVWEERVSPTDLNNGLATKENNLGNPDVNGKVISSTAAGVRSWIKAASAWLDLEDTPNSYVGNAGRLVSVTGSEDSLELVDYSTALFIGTTPKASPVAGALWLNSNDGQIYTWYTSPIGGNSQWIKDNVGAI